MRHHWQGYGWLTLWQLPIWFLSVKYTIWFMIDNNCNNEWELLLKCNVEKEGKGKQRREERKESGVRISLEFHLSLFHRSSGSCHFVIFQFVLFPTCPTSCISSVFFPPSSSPSLKMVVLLFVVFLSFFFGFFADTQQLTVGSWFSRICGMRWLARFLCR